MDAVVLGWNPDFGCRWSTTYSDLVTRTGAGRRALERWTIGSARVPRVGTPAYLCLQGRTRGLLGRGTVCSAPFLSADPRRPGHVTPHILVEWTTLLPSADAIEVATLQQDVPEYCWSGSNAPAQVLEGDAAERLDRIWAAQSGVPGWGAVPPSLAGCHHWPVPSSG